MGFTDMMSSARGPGVIGFLLALLVLAGFGMLLLFSTSERFLGGGQTIESVIEHQQRDIDSMELALTSMQKTLAALPGLKVGGKNLETARREKLFATDKAAGIRASIAATKGAIEAITREMEVYKDKYRTFARTQAKGMTIARLETRDGTVYENVTVGIVDAVGMQISHADGGKRIAFEKLPDELQDRFQFDPKQKTLAIAKENAVRTTHDTSVDSALAAVKEKAEKQREADALKLRADTQTAISVKEARIKPLEQEIKNLNSSIALESTKRISNAPQLRAQLAQKSQQLADLRADVARLRASL